MSFVMLPHQYRLTVVTCMWFAEIGRVERLAAQAQLL